MIENLKRKVLTNVNITSEEAIALSNVENKQELYDAANVIREHFCGNQFDLCSITNAKSGKCSENCKWCSQSAHYKTDIEEYEIVDFEETINKVVVEEQKGVKRHSLVTSGRTVNEKTLGELIEIFKAIKQKSNIGLCASLGLVNKEQLAKLKSEVGIEHYHCNLETAPSNFANLCTTHTIEEKIETIKAAQSLGINVCSGGIIGLGETMEQRIELALTLRDLNIKSIPINVLMPIDGTPLQNAIPLSEDEILTTIALFRFINPDAYIRFAGGRMKIKPFQDRALNAGVNAALTGDYLTTTGSDIDQDLIDFKNAGFSV